MITVDKQKWRKSPFEVPNKDLVSNLQAAEPKYFFTTSSIPNQYYFSHLLKSFVEHRKLDDFKKSNSGKPTKTCSKLTRRRHNTAANLNSKSNYGGKFSGFMNDNNFSNDSTSNLLTPFSNPFIQNECDFNCGFPNKLDNRETFQSERSAFFTPPKSTPSMKKFDIATMLGFPSESSTVLIAPINGDNDPHSCAGDDIDFDEQINVEN